MARPAVVQFMIRSPRRKTHGLEALRAAVEKYHHGVIEGEAFATVWQRVVAHAGEQFSTVEGLPFRYALAGACRTPSAPSRRASADGLGVPPTSTCSSDLPSAIAFRSLHRRSSWRRRSFVESRVTRWM